MSRVSDYDCAKGNSPEKYNSLGDYDDGNSPCKDDNDSDYMDLLVQEHEKL